MEKERTMEGKQMKWLEDYKKGKTGGGDTHKGEKAPAGNAGCGKSRRPTPSPEKESIISHCSGAAGGWVSGG